MHFNELGLSEPIIKALTAKKYAEPTPIQQKAIPVLLEGRDLCGIAQTGTGKTAAFALPSLDYFARNPKPTPIKGCRMLVLSPTRELAAQREPGGVITPDEDEGSEDGVSTDANELDESLAVQGVDDAD